MKKLIGIVVMFAVLGGGFWLYQNFSNLAKKEAEKIASRSLGAPVTIKKLDVSFSDKTVTVAGLKIGNPKSYKTNHAMNFDLIEIEAESLSREKLIFKNILISGTDVNLEVKEKTTNLAALRDHSQKHRNARPAGKKPVRVIIRALQLNNTTLNPAHVLVNKTMQPVALPDIEINGLGEKDNGILAAEAIAQIVTYVTQVATKSAFQSGYFVGMSDEILKDMKYKYDTTNAVLDKVKTDFKKAEEEVKGLMQGLFKKEEQPAEPVQ